MEFYQCLSCFQEDMEIWCEGDAWYHLRQIVCELLAITRCVQQTVNVVEDVIFGDGVVAIVFTEGAQCGVRDVVDAIRWIVNTIKSACVVWCFWRFWIPISWIASWRQLH